MVTEKMREAGSQIASDLIDAEIAWNMNGLGGSKKWNEFVEGHSGKNFDLIMKHVDDKIDSVTAIYIAMNRVSDNPDNENDEKFDIQSMF